MNEKPTDIFSHRKYWAECFGPAPWLPMSRAEMDQLGWDSCDIIIVTGDAYVDHPSFGMAVIGRVLEGQGFRVGIISQPDWRSAEAFRALGKPNLFFGIAAGNMDSMINHYTADKKRRNDDAYTAGDIAGKRPDRAVTVYSQRAREAYKDVPVVIGGIEASLRRMAHYDYWSDKVRRSVLVDSKADILLYGNAERAIVDLAHGLAEGKTIEQLRHLRGTAYVTTAPEPGYRVIDSTSVDQPGKVDPHLNPYQGMEPEVCETEAAKSDEDTADPQQSQEPVQVVSLLASSAPSRDVIRLPSFEAVKDDPVLYAHAARVMHKETNPHNALALIQAHGDREVWFNPPPIPLSTPELDWVFEQPYQRRPHPDYGDAKIPALEMIQHSVNIMRGCFGGCTFCSITEHEGRIIQNRSEDSIVREIEKIRDTSPNFTGVISDLGGPTANMWRLACKSEEIESKCRKLSCVFPGICKNLNTDQTPLIHLYRRARAIPGIKKVLIASGLRYDIAVETPEYVKELVTHHVGGYLKIAPEHTEEGPLDQMMKPGIGTYDRFKNLFDKYSKAAGKKQYLIPYFIAAHPGTTDNDMVNLALWLKRNKFRADQVQTFYPSPMALATAMYHSEKNPLKKVDRDSKHVPAVRSIKQRRLHKAFLRYHDSDNWPALRDALKKIGRRDLIGNGAMHLVPSRQPPKRHRVVKTKGTTPFRTKHTKQF
ncbi:Fe-S oxidoreductase [gamma proteobacterium HIMB55]|nr:Fe-S oxidoreductase [gamma proteobacterium HIMB55]